MMDKTETIVLTRTEDKNKQLMTKWNFSTIKIKSVPLIQKVPLPFQIDLSIHYDWLFFTSASTVQFFFDTVKYFDKYKIAAIGSKTASELKKRNITIDFIPSQFETRTFIAEWLAFYGKRNQSILFPQSKIGRLDISNELACRGHKVNLLPIYNTVPNRSGQKKLSNLLKVKKNIIITLASPSAWYALKNILTQHASFQLASIGSVTSKAIQRDGYQVAYQPTTFTMESLIELILKEVTKNE